ncbi:MAG: tRNA (adenosine(37)-N6)-threonylcarbamoyltransferase complex dimerization subunit type 1 TsaB [Deltaproteobacteria bacterium]|nr:tRNA (adenosine(37)-N6)-threonylcarbamoyltransferase complex dimerization subunit type 1 TsaB [Deltaproteobacteria bacterium]
MKTLALSTSSTGASVALVERGEVRARRHVDEDRLHAERVFTMIDEVLAEVGMGKRDVELLACDLGPGSFTGVRVGVASAKGIALGLGVPIVGVGSLEAMALTGAEQALGSVVLAILDARRGERFVAAHGREGVVLSPRHVVTASLTALFESLGSAARYVGDAGGVLDEAQRLRGLGCDLPDAGVIGRIGERRFVEGQRDDLAALEPVYVRPPDAALPATAPDYRVSGR